MLAEALKMMLCDDRQHDMQKAAAFVKRLATFSLCFGSAESMSGIFCTCFFLFHYQMFVVVFCSDFMVLLCNFAALVTLRHLLQKNIKCRNLLENDAGGGSVSGTIAVSSWLPLYKDRRCT